MSAYPAALTRALRTDDPEAVAAVVSRLGAEVLARTRADGSDAIDQCIEHGALAALDACLRLGADPDRRDSTGLLPMCIFACNGNVDALRLLLRHGASPDRQDAQGNTVLHAAAHHTEEPALTEVFDLLLASPVCLDRQNVSGQTPLHVAIEKERFALATRLLEAGADPTIHDRYSHTPMSLVMRGASRRRGSAFLTHPEFIERLLAHGVDPNQRAPDHDYPLTVAACADASSLVDALIEHGAHPRAADRFGDTALHWACSARVAQRLLRAGADADHANIEGATPLHKAVERELIPVIETLLSAGANPERRAVTDATPIDLARRQNHAGITQLLCTPHRAAALRASLAQAEAEAPSASEPSL